MKRVFITLAGLALAVSALAQLSKYKGWEITPEAYFLTPAERAEWKQVTSDADAEKFIAIYFAKRGGDQFREGMKRRIAAADEQFKMQRQKGSEKNALNQWNADRWREQRPEQHRQQNLQTAANGGHAAQTP